MESPEFARSFLLLALLVIWYHIIYRRMRIFIYREDLFTIRDYLWDFMLKNNISFETYSYKIVRRQINALIRMAPSMGFILVLFLVFTERRRIYRPTVHAALEDEKNELLRRQLAQSMNQVISRTYKFMLEEGLVGLIVRPIVWAANKSDRHKFPPPENMVRQTINLDANLAHMTKKVCT